MVMAMAEEPRVVDNPEQSRYELWVGSRRAGLIQYLPEEEDTLLLVHTEVDPAFAGQGLGERLVASIWRISAPVGSSSSRSVRSSVPTCAATPTRPTWSRVTRPSPSDHGHTS
jgi:predicted GNAT family acetyltransferase